MCSTKTKASFRIITKKLLSCLSATLLLCSAPVRAGPWINPGDEALRHHIQVLADAGIITTPITTYPLMWGSIAESLERAPLVDLNEAQRWSLSYVRHEFNRQSSAFNMETHVGLSSEVPIAQGFAADQREKTEASFAANWLGQYLSANLQVTVASDEIDSKEYRLDGSYVAAVLGNWSLSVGAVDRWWGPGWQDSLILSNNARPVPGIALQRNYADAFETPWLSWIGPWHIIAFAGQLENDRHIPDAKLIGMRITFKPFKNWEFGLNRTLQWGGEGRPQSLGSLWDAFIGKDNRGDDGITETNEPGNQLAGIDIRYGRSFDEMQLGLYTQGIGEDAAGYEPSHRIWLAGGEIAWASAYIHHRLYIEGSLSEASEGSLPDYAYEHSIYKSGYRYRDRSMGASYDNDTLVVTVAGDHHLAAGHHIYWKLAKVDLNRDNTNREFPGGNPLSDVALDFVRAEAGYKYRLSRKTQLGVKGFYQSEDIEWRNTDETIGSGAMFTVEHKW